MGEDHTDTKARSISFNMIWIEVSRHGQSWGGGQGLFECSKCGLAGIVPDKISFNGDQCIERTSKLSEILNKAMIEVEEPKKTMEVLL